MIPIDIFEYPFCSSQRTKFPRGKLGELKRADEKRWSKGSTREQKGKSLYQPNPQMPRPREVSNASGLLTSGTMEV